MKQKNQAWGHPQAPALTRWGRKTLSLFLSVVLCLSMLPATALADEPTPTANEDHPHTADTKHPVCGAAGSSCTDPNHSSHTDITNWMAWDKSTEMPTETGNYYLTTDVTLTDMWQPAAGTVLCLNGYSITRESSDNYRAIQLPYREGVTNNSFTLTDCAETQGVITHTEDSIGGGIDVRAAALFNMYGGTISGNNSAGGYGAGVCVIGTFNLYGGKICNNTTTRMEGGGGVYAYSFNMYGGTIENNKAEGVRGGGVSLDDHSNYFNMYGGTIQNNTASYGGGVYSHSRPFYVSGNAKIINNTATSKGGGICGRQSSYKQELYISGSVQIKGNTAAGKTENISLTDKSNVAEPLHIVDALTSDAYVGISGVVGSAAADGKQISSGATDHTITESDLSHLHSDNEEYILKLENNQVTLAEDTRPVAKIGSTTYTSLQDAINAAQGMSDNPTIVLGRDTTPASLSIISGTFTIDLAGHSIALTTQNSAVTLQGTSAENAVKLTIKDSGSGGSMSSYAMLFDVEQYATLTIENGSYTSLDSEPIYARLESAVVLVKDGTFTGKRAGITCYQGNVTIKNGTFTGTQYGACKSGSGQMTISGGTFNGGTRSLYVNDKYAGIKLSGGVYQNGIERQYHGVGYNLTPSMDSYELVTADGKILYPNDLTEKVYTGYLKVQERAIKKIQVTGGWSVNYGYTSPSVITVNIEKADRVKNEAVTYKWSLNKRVEPGNTWEQEELDSTEATASYTIPLGLPAGDYKYTVTATCAGESRSASTTVFVHQRAVKITGVSAKDKVYDGTEEAEVDGTPTLEKPENLTWEGTGNQAAGGVLNGDKDKVGVVVGTATFSDKNVGPGKEVTFSGFTLTGEAAGNYFIYGKNGQPESTTASITQRPVTVSGITAKNKIYDGTTEATLNYNGVAFAGKVDGDTLTVTATGAFDSADAGEDKTVTITGLMLGGTDVNNYSLAAEGQQTTATATINKKPVTVSGITAENKTYDGNTNAALNFGNAVLNGKIGDETLSVTASGAFENADAGENKIVNLTSLALTGANAENYVLATDGQQATATATINKKPVTVSGITAASKTYDGTTNAAIQDTGTLGGAVANETVDYAVTAQFADKNVGTNKTVNLKVSLTGDSAKNYAIADQSQKTATADITKKDVALIGGITATNRVYVPDNFTVILSKGTLTFDGLISGEMLDVTLSGGTVQAPDAGEKKAVSYEAVLANGQNGDAGNYNLSGKPEVTVNITKAEGSITTAPEAISGLVYNGEKQTLIKAGTSATGEVQYKLGADGTYSKNLPQAANAGTYTVYYKVVGDNNHEDVAENSIPVTIGKAAATITVKDQRAYVGSTAPDLSAPQLDKDYTVSGLFGKDTLTKAPTLTYVETPDMSKTGEATIRAAGAENSNYTFTYVDGKLTIARRSSSSSPTYSVTTPDKPANGALTVSPKSAKQGETVTITVTPETGYVVQNVRVTDKSGKDMSLTKKSDTQYTFVMPAGQVEVKADFAKEGTAQSKFVDVKESDYFYDAVQWAAAQGITSGTDAEHFSPNASCTRAQIVTFLWRAAGSPEPKQGGSFTDVAAESYYAKAVAWAVENGITTGTGAETFSPDATCTREQAVTFLYRAAGSPAVSGGSAFRDVADSAYYASAVVWAERNGITGGIGGGLFGSGNDCTRGQIVTFLYRANQQ